MTPDEMRCMAEQRRAQSESEYQKALEQIARYEALYERFGDVDDWDKGTVLMWERQYDERGHSYTFMAVLGGDRRWHLTGRNRFPLSHDELVSNHLRHASEVWVVSEWQQV